MLNYCCHTDKYVLIPIEYLSAKGISSHFSGALIDDHKLSAESIELFNRAYQRYWRRSVRLYQNAPAFWFPPRAQHILIVKKPECIPPYSQPFNKNSWQLHITDLDKKTSSVEFVAYQFLHLERMWLLQQLDTVLVANLSYFLTLSDAQIEDFAFGCRHTTRPDAAAFRFLASQMPAIQKLHHTQLKKPQATVHNAKLMQATGLILPSNLHRILHDIQHTWSATATEVSIDFKQFHSKPAEQPGKKLCDWLIREQPALLITGADGQVLWDPDRPDDIQLLSLQLDSSGASAETAMLNDLSVINIQTRRFLSSLRAPEELVDPAPYITEGGLCYIHKQRKLICYNIGPGRNETRLWRPTPPYERKMLEARTVHEWGHLAAESGWVIIPADSRTLRSEQEQILAKLFDQIAAAAPANIQHRLANEVARLQAESGSLGQTLLNRMLVRIEDFMANLVAARLLHPDAMDTYVRNNVHCHLQSYSSEGVYMQLIRLAYEFQYLRLSRIEDPFRWFYNSTWFVEYFIDNKIISKSLFEQLTNIIKNICDCYQLDESKFDFPQVSIGHHQ